MSDHENLITRERLAFLHDLPEMADHEHPHQVKRVVECPSAARDSGFSRRKLGSRIPPRFRSTVLLYGTNLLQKDREEQSPQRTGRRNSSGKMYLSAKLRGLKPQPFELPQFRHSNNFGKHGYTCWAGQEIPPAITYQNLAPQRCAPFIRTLAYYLGTNSAKGRPSDTPSLHESRAQRQVWAARGCWGRRIPGGGRGPIYLIAVSTFTVEHIMPDETPSLSNRERGAITSHSAKRTCQRLQTQESTGVPERFPCWRIANSQCCKWSGMPCLTTSSGLRHASLGGSMLTLKPEWNHCSADCVKSCKPSNIKSRPGAKQRSPEKMRITIRPDLILSTSGAGAGGRES